MCKISVIVPIYNAENFLTESINSLLNQTFTDFEVICINDGSKDQSLRLINNIQKRDNRIKVINKTNGGCGSARNVGIENAKGEYIYFFDPDDYISPDAFQKLYENAKNNKSDMVISQIAWYTEGNKINFDKPGFDLENVFENIDFNKFTFNYKQIKEYVLNSYFAPWTKLYNTRFLKYDNNFRFEENIAFDDVPFHVKTILKAQRISFVPEAFYQYRTSNKNSVNNTSTNSIDIIRICDMIEDILKENNIFEDFKSNFYQFKIIQLILYLISSNSEIYYKSVKYNLMRIDINELELPDETIKKYNRVVNSNTYNEYRKTNNARPLENETNAFVKVDVLEKENLEMKNKINNLVKTNESLTRDNQQFLTVKKQLTKYLAQNESLTNEKEILENEKYVLVKENKEIKTANDSLKQYNLELSQENDELQNQNAELLKDNNELKKVNNAVLSSNSWKLTKPLRFFKTILKK